VKPDAPVAKDGEKPDPLAEFDEIENTKDWTASAARRFKEVKAEAKSAAARASELESAMATKDARLAELEALSKDNTASELQAKLAEYENTMLLHDLEKTNAYKALVATPMAAIVSAVDDVASRNNIDPDTLLDVLALSDAAVQEEKLTELLASASDRDRFRIYKAVEEIKPVLAQRTVLQANVKEALAEASQLDEARKQSALADQVRSRTEAASAVSTKLTTKLSFLASLEGVDMPAFAKVAATIDPAALDPVTGTYHALAAQLLPKLAAGYARLQAELGVLTDKLADYDKATPKAGGGSQAPTKAGGPVDGKSFLEAVDAAFG
jgi:hypothetical protein